MSVPQWNADIITPEEEGSGTKVLDGNQVVQPTLEGGTNITISDGTISATGGGSEYYAGEGIVISNENAISITETVRDGAALGATSVQPADLSGYVLATSLATVATSGDYDDLLDKPTIPTVDQTYNAASTNAQSGVAVSQAIAGIPSAPTYTAGDGIAISAQDAISAKVGGGVTIGNASSTAAVTDDLSVTPIRDGSTRLYPIFGRLTADTANALANGGVTIKTLIDWNDRYFSTKYRPGIFVYDASWGFNKNIAMMFGTDPISGSILANTEIVYDINDVNASLSNLTIETILANPTNYVFFAMPCDSNGDIEWDATYYHVTTSTAAAVISTASYQGTVTVPNSIILENPLPSPTSADAAKVLTVTDTQGNFSWQPVPQELPPIATNANKVLSVNSGATGVEWANVPQELPSVTGNAGKVLAVNSGATGTEWVNFTQIEVVSSMPASPTSGVLYIVTGA